MRGPIALHGGAEFHPGDEPFLEALLAAGARRAGGARPVRVSVVPTAAARGRPDLAAAFGVAAFERVAAASGTDVEVVVVGVVDRASAADGRHASRLVESDVIHFPGGDPDLIPTVMPGTVAWAAVTEARAAGAILAGASAGAMALCPWTWTAGGGMAGLRVVHGLVVVPHARPETWLDIIERFGAWAPPGLGALGLAEHTGVIEEPHVPGSATIGWRVFGPGEARWLAVIGGKTVVARSGEVIETPVIPL